MEVRTVAIKQSGLLHLYNFTPSSPDYKLENSFKSPVAELNQHEYHENWLSNLMIAGSMNGNRCQHTKTL